jgi:hypothetical protein
MDNPYLDEFLPTVPSDEPTARSRKEERFVLCRKYAWSVPTEEAIRLLVRIGPLVEVGAGTGYWASLIRAAGGDIIAYDRHPPDMQQEMNVENNWHWDVAHTFTRVETGGLEVLDWHTDRTLLLCWPPYSNQTRPETYADVKEHLRGCMGYQALRRWRGERVIYVGEWRCCTAGWAFHDLLERRWRKMLKIELPHWPGIWDRLSVHERIPRNVKVLEPAGAGAAST